MKSNDLARGGVHGDPYPLLVSLFLDKAGHLISFHLKPLDHHILFAGDRLDVQMIRQDLKALDEKAQEPLEGDTHRTTNTPQRDTFQQ